MRQKTKGLIKYNIKVFWRRNKILLGLLLLVVIAQFFLVDFEPLAFTKSINIIDNDQTEISRKFIDQLNYSQTDKTTKRIIIPMGFGENYSSNKSTFVEYMNIDHNELSLRILNTQVDNRVRLVDIVPYSIMSVLIILYLIINSFTSDLFDGKYEGKIAYMTNFVSFWTLFIISNVLAILFAIGLVIYVKSIFILFLIIESVLLMMYIILSLPRYNALLSNTNLTLIGVVGIPYFLSLQDYCNFPIVNNFCYTHHWIWIPVNLVIIGVLSYLISKKKPTEVI